MRCSCHLALGLLVAIASSLTASTALATFHEVSIREVYPGSAAQPDSEYIELQMWAPDQNLVDGHSIVAYDATGAAVGTTTFAGAVSGSANQSTLLAATPAAASEFGVGADVAMTAGQLDPDGGAVCWESLDCVSWGSFGGMLPSPGGSPAAPAGIPDGMALRRVISPGCATLLEASDDRDNSAADFSVVFPAPRPNSVPPAERACGSTGSQAGGNSAGRGAPQTTLQRKPPRKTRDRTPTFRFSSDEPRSTFECKLDARPFKRCRSPFTLKQLPLGRHTFKVRARDESGGVDPTPASFAFKLIAKRR